MKKKLMRAFALGAIGSVALAGCSGGGAQGSNDAAAGPKEDGLVRSTIVAAPSSFDPVDALGLPDFVAARASFDTLLRVDDSGLVPGLASEWESTPTTVELGLREGATCSDGTPITATVVKNSLDHLATSDGPNGAMSFGGQLPDITADDDAGTVRIELENPWPTVAESLSVATSGIICPAGLADLEGLKAGHVEGAESGPYIMTKAEPGIRYSYTLREDYSTWPEWTTEIKGNPPAEIQYVVSEDTSAAANLVLDGQLDVARILDDSVPRFEGDGGYKLSTYPFGDYYLLFNERESSPFADQKLREAVAQAVDRETFNDVVNGGLGEPAVSVAKVSATCVADDDSALFPYDPEAAQALDGVKIRLIGPNVAGTNGAGNVYIQEVLRAAGADVELENVDVGAWISRVFAEPSAWDLTVYADLNFVGTLTNPLMNFYGPSTEDGGTNIGAVQDAEFEEHFQRGLGESEEEASCAEFQAAGDIINTRAHAAPLVVEPFIYVQRPGFEVTLLGGTLDDHILRILD